MKKSFLLIIAFALAAIMTGCGNSGSSASSSSTPAATNANTAASDVAFEVAPQESSTNVTYVTSAKGDVPPAPPSSSVPTYK